jgi:hypothetical protein
MSQDLPARRPGAFVDTAFEGHPTSKLRSHQRERIVIIGAQTVSYKIVAEKDGKTVTTERVSLLVTAARARIGQAKGGMSTLPMEMGSYWTGPSSINS